MAVLVVAVAVVGLILPASLKWVTPRSEDFREKMEEEGYGEWLDLFAH